MWQIDDGVREIVDAQKSTSTADGWLPQVARLLLLMKWGGSFSTRQNISERRFSERSQSAAGIVCHADRRRGSWELCGRVGGSPRRCGMNDTCNTWRVFTLRRRWRSKNGSDMEVKLILREFLLIVKLHSHGNGFILGAQGFSEGWFGVCLRLFIIFMHLLNFFSSTFRPEYVLQTWQSS